jgi:calcium-dependent protein kinase
MVNFKSTSDELEDLKNTFILLDTSKDGTLSKDEMKDGMEKVLGGLRANKKEFEELIKNLDKNGDGVIDYAEFITAAIDKTLIINRDNLSDAFKLIDTDNSGMITISELKAVFDSRGSKDEHMWDDIMKEVDKNRDNQISFDEFMDVMQDFVKKSKSKNQKTKK